MILRVSLAVVRSFSLRIFSGIMRGFCMILSFPSNYLYMNCSILYNILFNRLLIKILLLTQYDKFVRIQSGNVRFRTAGIIYFLCMFMTEYR